MVLETQIQQLYTADTKESYQLLKDLEEISQIDNSVYPYFDELIRMLKNDKYVVRVRGIRLLCLQAKWDSENKINKNIDIILNSIHDEKPTAVRQALQYLMKLVPYKKEMQSIIKEKVLKLDCSKFQDTMKPLLEKDIRHLIELIENQ